MAGRLAGRIAPMSDLHPRLKGQRAKHDRGFDGPAPATEVSVNLKIHVQRVGLDLCKGSLGTAYWARVSWLEHEQRILQTHVLFLRRTLEFWSKGALCVRARSSLFSDVKRKICLKSYGMKLLIRSWSCPQARSGAARLSPLSTGSPKITHLTELFTCSQVGWVISSFWQFRDMP